MTLPASLYSPNQLSELTMELRSYIDALRDVAIRNRTGSKQSSLPGTSSLLKEVFEQSSGSMTPEDMLRELEQTLKSAPVVHIMFAKLPDKELRRQLILWFRTEIHQHALLTFSERHDIGGGMVVRTSSHVYDFSFKRRILDNKQRITEL